MGEVVANMWPCYSSACVKVSGVPSRVPIHQGCVGMSDGHGACLDRTGPLEASTGFGYLFGIPRSFWNML
jgi:hypothetical protein